MDISREQHYCPLHLNDQRFSPEEIVCDYPKAFIIGELGSGKTSLIAYIVRELLKGSCETKYLPLPVRLRDYFTEDCFE